MAKNNKPHKTETIAAPPKQKFDIYAKITVYASITVNANSFEEAAAKAKELNAADFVNSTDTGGLNDWLPIDIYSINRVDPI